MHHSVMTAVIMGRHVELWECLNVRSVAAFTASTIGPPAARVCLFVDENVFLMTLSLIFLGGGGGGGMLLVVHWGKGRSLFVAMYCVR